MIMNIRRHLVGLVVIALGAQTLVGCFVRPTQTVDTVQMQSVVMSQPSQVVYAQPQVVYRQPTVYVRQQPVYVQQPVVYRQSSSVITPVRVSLPSQLYSYTGGHCIPGTSRVCEAYCGGGIQYCNPDGYSWGSCIESY